MLEVKIIYDPEYHCHDLVVLHNEKEIRRHSDGMEPEDVMFYRDLSWIGEAVLEAYELGKKDMLEKKEKKDGI